jgi:chorismate mutase/prephenate dehydratase
MCHERIINMENKLEKARKIINEADAQMAELFVKRMKAVEMVFEYKKEFGLPILDSAREQDVITKNAGLIEDEVLKTYATMFKVTEDKEKTYELTLEWSKKKYLK